MYFERITRLLILVLLLLCVSFLYSITKLTFEIRNIESQLLVSIDSPIK